MKIPHILDSTPEQNEKELVFVMSVNSHKGELHPAHYQPKNWSCVRHITGDLYYAWDRHHPKQGVVYIGKWK
ncbi:hypothetical protein N9955_00490 [bacterium]|nr:hypothetical protein [bacterium]